MCFIFLAQCLKIQYKSVNLLKIMSSNVDKDTCRYMHWGKLRERFSLLSESSDTPLDLNSVLHLMCNQPVYKTEQTDRTHTLTHSNA